MNWGCGKYPKIKVSSSLPESTCTYSQDREAGRGTISIFFLMSQGKIKLVKMSEVFSKESKNMYLIKSLITIIFSCYIKFSI